MAIFVLSDELHMLQGFTDDETQLLAALSVKSAGSNLSATPAANQASSDLTRTEGNQNGADSAQSASYQTVLGMLKHMETSEGIYLIDRRVDMTADALQEIARFLVGIPGRKNLIWLSAGFPAGILSDSDLSSRDSFEVTRNYSSTIMKVSDLLSLSHIAVYPVDVRGLQVNPMFSAASNQTFEPGTGKDLKAVRNFASQNNSEHATMESIANETGGHAFYNVNGLAEAADQAVREGSINYTLTYSPERPFDGSLRHIRVEVSKPGYHLSYRRSYFASNLENAAGESNNSPSNLLATTLQHGAPMAHELFFEAQVQVSGDPVPATADQMELLSHYEALNLQGKTYVCNFQRPPLEMQRYTIHYGLLLRQIGLTSAPDGKHHGTLEFSVVAFDADGKKLAGLRSAVEDTINLERYKLMQSVGYQFVQAIDVPVQAAFMRLAVRDLSDNRLGCLELRLPLAPAPQIVQGVR